MILGGIEPTKLNKNKTFEKLDSKRCYQENKNDNDYVGTQKKTPRNSEFIWKRKNHQWKRIDRAFVESVARLKDVFKNNFEVKDAVINTKQKQTLLSFELNKTGDHYHSIYKLT